MAILKDPDELPDEYIEFSEVFSDINTPEIWIAQSEDDLGPKAIILDGHSSILVYTKETEDLKWEAFNEIGQYKYQPDSVGDGIIVFPHTFYYELTIELSALKLEVSATFDGTGIKAIVMPLKDESIDNFFSALTKRLSSTISSVLKPADDRLVIQEGTNLEIPDSLTSNLSLKLAMMGINLSTIKVLGTEAIERKEEIVEGVFEEPEPVEEVLEEAEMDEFADMEETSATTGSIASIPPPPPASGPGAGGRADDIAPPPSVKAKKSAKMAGPPSPPPAQPATEPQDTTAKGAPPRAPAPNTVEKKSAPQAEPMPEPTPAPAPTKQKERSARSRAIDKTAKEEAPREEEPIADSLIARGMEKEAEESISLKNAHVSWFERMLQQRTYPLIVTISSEEMKVKKSITSPISGEKVSEKSEQLVVSTLDPFITVRPDFPGCLVVPAQQKVRADSNKSELTFHVTPLTLGHVLGQVNFIQNDRSIHKMTLDSKVITHRISRWSAALGTLAGTIPAIVAFFFGTSPQNFMNTNYVDSGLEFLDGIGYFGPFILSLIFFGIAGAGYFLQQPVKRARDIAFST